MNNANNDRLMGLDSRYKESYRYRDLPCSIRPDNELWYVAGTDHHPKTAGGGVLEWCYDQNDAEHRLAIMQQYDQFSNLRVGPFIRPTKEAAGAPAGRDTQYEFLEYYAYRGYSAQDVVGSDGVAWFVAGEDHGPRSTKEGILEWCFGEFEAATILKEMSSYPQFSNLTVGSRAVSEPTFKYKKGQMLRTKKGWLVGTVTDTHRGKYGFRYCLRVRSKMDSKTFNQVWLFEDELSDCTPDGFVLLPQDPHFYGYRD